MIRNTSCVTINLSPRRAMVMVTLFVFEIVCLNKRSLAFCILCQLRLRKKSMIAKLKRDGVTLFEVRVRSRETKGLKGRTG